MTQTWYYIRSNNERKFTAMLEGCNPIKTFRGTLAEVLTHQGEIPPESVVEVRVYPSSGQTEEPSLADSLAGLIDEASHIEKGEPTRYSNSRKQAFSEAIGRKFKQQGL